MITQCDYTWTAPAVRAVREDAMAVEPQRDGERRRLDFLREEEPLVQLNQRHLRSVSV